MPDAKTPRPKPKGRAQRFATHPVVWAVLVVACLLGGLGYLVTGCGDWTPSEPFTRNAPDVDRAIDLYDAGQYESAEEALTTYLTTGPCSDGSIGLPKRVYEKYNGSFDLGLTLFRMAEKYGERFGDEEKGDAGADEPVDEQRSLEIDCAQIIVKAIGSDVKVPVDLRARAWYLSGNLEFLRKEYEAAVTSYDESLKLIPGIEGDAGVDEIGRDAAWNRAIALRRLREEEEQDAGQDAEPDADEEQEEPEEPDAGEDDAGEDGGDPDAGDGGEEDGGDAGDGGEDDQDAGDDAGDDAGEEQKEDGDAGGEEPDAGGDSGGGEGDDEPQQSPIAPEGDDQPPSSSQSQMDRLLDELEEAPTYQEEQSKQRAAEGRRRRVMEDK
ncbi:MAG TPA: hypothetical protein ENK57_20225 [Polyangiaceae bacterium]|nr:hypothetical protein [Polyangiaceae bacterium]